MFDTEDDAIEQEFAFNVRYYRYHVYQNHDKKPIAKFNSHFYAERFINLIHDEEKTWTVKNSYRLSLNGKTQITL